MSNPDNLLVEAGIHYFRDNQNNTYKGWKRVYYEYTHNHNHGVNSIFLECSRHIYEQLEKLCDYWSRENYTYTPVNRE